MLKAECGVDYLTCTLPLEDENGPLLLSIGHKLQKEVQSEGNTIAPCSLLGYTGAKCGSIFAGSGNQGYMVRVSGAKALDAVQQIKVAKPRITRIDLQVTVWYESDSDLIIRKHYETSYNDARVADKRARRKVTKWEANDGGYTIYIGSRQSAYFGRVYDKHKESKDDEYKNAIRYEVEVHQEQAEAVFRLFKYGKTPKEKQIVSFVGEWFAARGIRPDWVFEVGLLEALPVKRETSDDARRLKWLRTQVRHTCMELRKRVDTQVILDALGFFEPLSDEETE